MDSPEILDALEAIAIVGMAGRFPEANDIETFWQNLQNGLASISFFTDQELTVSGIESRLSNAPNHVKAGLFWQMLNGLTLHFLASTPMKPKLWTPSTVSFWSAPGRPWNMPDIIPKRITAQSVYTRVHLQTRI